MALDIVELKKYSKHLKEQAEKEMTQNISKNLIKFVLDDDLTESFKIADSRKVTEQSKRVIGHWVKKGIIKAKQNYEGGWYYFNRTETIWIDIVTQLREFGLELEKIKKIRQQLFTETVPNFRMIDFVLMYSVLKSPYVMLVFMDGEVRFTTSKLYGQTIQDEVMPPHIVFNFFHLAKNIFPNNNFNIAEKSVNDDLSANELKLLYYLRTGDYKEVKVKMKEGEVYLIEGEKEHSISNKIIDIINQSQYQNIEIKVADGRIVHIGSVEKTKLK